MSAVGPLPHLYKEAAWAIKWVDPGLYDTLTAPGGKKETKEALLIKFFELQETERAVVFEESEGGGAARDSVLNDAGKGILEALVTMSKPAAVRVDRGAQRAQRIEAEKRATEEVWKSYARLLAGDYTTTTQQQMKAVRDITSIKTIDSDVFETYKNLASFLSNDVAKAPLPSFARQIELFEKLYERDSGAYKKALFNELNLLRPDVAKDAYLAMTGESIQLLDADQERPVTGSFAAKAALVYVQSLPRNTNNADGFF